MIQTCEEFECIALEKRKTKQKKRKIRIKKRRSKMSKWEEEEKGHTKCTKIN